MNIYIKTYRKLIRGNSRGTAYIIDNINSNAIWNKYCKILCIKTNVVFVTLLFVVYLELSQMDNIRVLIYLFIRK